MVSGNMESLIGEWNTCDSQSEAALYEISNNKYCAINIARATLFLLFLNYHSKSYSDTSIISFIFSNETLLSF